MADQPVPDGSSAAPRFVHRLAARLEATAAHRVVVSDAAARATGAELAALVENARSALARRDVQAGHRVLIVTENSVATVVALLATTALGAWPVLINARLTAAEIARIRSHAEPTAELFTTGLSTAAQAHAKAALADGVVDCPGLEIAGSIGGAAEPTDDGSNRAVAALLYTSGTTGEPKGVMLTHANLLYVARESGAIRGLGPDDCVYGVLPISHVFGLASVCLGSLLAGAHLHLVPRFEATAAAGALGTDGITIFQGVPTMYQRLLQTADAQGGTIAAPNLRYLSAGGAPLDVSLKRRVEALWGLPLHNGYGLTETSPTVTTTRSEVPAIDETVGPLLPDTAIRIVGADTGAEVSPGEIGEIWVKGPGVMRGYYKSAQETARVMTPDGWFRSGDLGRIDAAGNLYIVGRLKELIIRSGFNVYPPEVEAVLSSFPDVALAAVVGRRVDGNEEVVAFIEPAPGATLDLEAVAAHAARALAPYKRPSRYVVRSTLPVTSAGKIKKAELAREANGA